MPWLMKSIDPTPVKFSELPIGTPWASSYSVPHYLMNTEVRSLVKSADSTYIEVTRSETPVPTNQDNTGYKTPYNSDQVFIAVLVYQNPR